MTVQQLRDQLQEMPQDAPVCVGSEFNTDVWVNTVRAVDDGDGWRRITIHRDKLQQITPETPVTTYVHIG